MEFFNGTVEEVIKEISSKSGIVVSRDKDKEKFIEDCLNNDSLRISIEQEATKVVREIVLDEEKRKEDVDVELPK